MRTLSIDIETYSSTDLLTSGVYKYVEAEDFEILLFAYAFDDGPVKLVDLACGEKLPYEIIVSLLDPSVLKVAFNANFERTCLAEHLEVPMPPEQWECTMVKAACLGLSFSLDAVARALNLDVQKDAAGKRLIRTFSVPCKATKTNGGRTRNLPKHDPESWQKFRDYCVTDVEVERAIRKKMTWFELPEHEKRLWALDQRINDRGAMLDPVLIESAIAISDQQSAKLKAEAIAITGLDNPNSVKQLKDWLEQETDTELPSLNKTVLPDLLNSIDSNKARRVIEIRQQASKTSIRKYQAMQQCICEDLRARGLLQFYGANRTGRWAGRLIQVQNLPKNKIKTLETARQLARETDADLIELVYGSVPSVISQLVRTAFVAKPGHRFIVADFSAIEARVIAWLAGEKWRLEVFQTHGKIYEASASKMFGVPIETVTKDSPYRNKGKMAELALGYQGGPAAIQRIEIGNETPTDQRIPESELTEIVAAWRVANPNIVNYWRRVLSAATNAVIDPGCQVKVGDLKFYMEKNILFIELPSGRRLSYIRPVITDGQYGKVLKYEGVDQTTKRWGRIDTYGGKLTENIVQAISRDLLSDAMLRLDEAGYPIVLHVHDEIVAEMPAGTGSTDEVARIMSAPIQWAAGLPLKAEVFETEFYKKD